MDIDGLKKKVEDALPDDATVEQVAEAITGHTPDAVDVHVAKAEQWAKDHNKD